MAEEKYSETLQKIKALQSELETILASVYALDRDIALNEEVLKVLNSMEGLKGERELLIHLGPVLLKAEIKDTSKVYLDLGGGIITETPLQEAKEKLTKNIAEMIATREKLLARAGAIREEISKLIAEVRKIGQEEGKG